MRKLLTIFTILVSITVALFSCGDTSGPRDILDPTASILTVTLEETCTFKSNETTVSSALSEEHSSRGEVTLERNSKGGHQAHAVWTQCPDDNFAWYAIYRSDTPGISSNIEAADTSVIFTSVSGTSWLDTGISAGNTYYYVVRTVNKDDIDSWSNEVSVAIPDLTPLLTVFFIDPSHNDHYSGDVILLRTPENYYYLIDGGDRSGSWSCGVEKVLPILDSLGVDTLDGIVGTHPHSDHIGGLIGVLDNVPVAKAWDSGLSYSTSTYQDYLQAIYDNGSDYITPRRGDILDWDDSLTVECIHPVEPLGTDPNNASITLRVTYGSVSFLFTGDLETNGGENVILDALNQGIIDDISADVLKVGHHGSYTSTSYSWLQAVDPDYAAIEVGYGNPYGHPHSEVIQRLENYGALIYRTDQDGTFIMTTDGTDLEIYP